MPQQQLDRTLLDSTLSASEEESFAMCRRLLREEGLLVGGSAGTAVVAAFYAVVYPDGRCLLLGGPRFTLAVEQVDRRLLLTDGDRTFKPRPRG